MGISNGRVAAAKPAPQAVEPKIDRRRRTSGIIPQKFGVRMKRIEREVIKTVADRCDGQAAGPFCLEILTAVFAGKDPRRKAKIKTKLADIEQIRIDQRKALIDAHENPDESVPFILDIAPDQFALLEQRATAQHLGAAELFRWIVFNVIEGRKVGAAVT